MQSDNKRAWRKRGIQMRSQRRPVMTVFREGRATAGHPDSALEMWTAFAHICWPKLLVDALCRPRPTLGILFSKKAIVHNSEVKPPLALQHQSLDLKRCVFVGMQARRKILCFEGPLASCDSVTIRVTES